jgi:hypothetical protein
MTTAASDIPSEHAHNGSNPHNTPETQAHPTYTIRSPNPTLDNTAPAAQHGAMTLAIETTSAANMMNRNLKIFMRAIIHHLVPYAYQFTKAAFLGHAQRLQDTSGCLNR